MKCKLRRRLRPAGKSFSAAKRSDGSCSRVAELLDTEDSAVGRGHLKRKRGLWDSLSDRRFKIDVAGSYPCQGGRPSSASVGTTFGAPPRAGGSWRGVDIIVQGVEAHGAERPDGPYVTAAYNPSRTVRASIEEKRLRPDRKLLSIRGRHSLDDVNRSPSWTELLDRSLRLRRVGGEPRRDILYIA